MEKQLLANLIKKPTRTCSLTLSEIITILIALHLIGFRNFKAYYLYLQQFHSREFGKLVSYNRFIELVNRILVPLYFFTQSLAKTKTGCYFMDSTTIKVCNMKRSYAHKVFKSIATKGKISIGWFLASVCRRCMQGGRNVNNFFETIIDQLKNISQIEHSRYRSISNFLVNLIVGITAYGLKEKKPSILTYI